MEEILILLIQFFAEVVGQALISIPFDCTCRIRKQPEDHPGTYAFAFLLVGGAVGWLSNAIVPSIIHVPALRIANLFITPIVGGTIGYHVAKWQYQSRNPLLVPRNHFWYTFFFTLGLASMRFAYAK